jgi:hypothetical protein
MVIIMKINKVNKTQETNDNIKYLSETEAWRQKRLSQKQDIEDIESGKKTYKDMVAFDWDKDEFKVDWASLV